jgi:hypothetical protein
MALKIMQSRRAVLDNGITKFEITSTVTEGVSPIPPMTSPLITGLFLVEIIDPDDPRDDSLVRIVKAGDLETYKNDRPLAIASGDGYYRASSFVRKYSTIDLAVTAMQLIQDRLDRFYAEWESYLDIFRTVTPGEAVEFPLVNSSLLNTRILGYIEKNTALVAAQTAVSAASGEIATVQADLAAAIAKRDAYASAVSVLETTISGMAALDTAVTAYGVLLNSIGTPPTDTNLWITPGGGTGLLSDISTWATVQKAEADLLTTQLAANTCTAAEQAVMHLTLGRIMAARSTGLTGINAFIAANSIMANGILPGVYVNATVAQVALASPSISSVELAYNEAVTEVALLTDSLITAERGYITTNAAVVQAKIDADASLALIVLLCPDFDIADPEAKLAT